MHLTLSTCTPHHQTLQHSRSHSCTRGGARRGPAALWEPDHGDDARSAEQSDKALRCRAAVAHGGDADVWLLLPSLGSLTWRPNAAATRSERGTPWDCHKSLCQRTMILQLRTRPAMLAARSHARSSERHGAWAYPQTNMCQSDPFIAHERHN